ncbi:hypothetical protein ABE107_15525 [Priestia megaterium]
MEININVNGENIKEKVKRLSKKTKIIIGTVVLALIIIPIWNSTYNSEENQAGREGKKAVLAEVEGMDNDFKYDVKKVIKIDGQVGDSINETKYYVYGVATEGNGATYGLRVKEYHYLDEDVWRGENFIRVDVPEDDNWDVYE